MNELKYTMLPLHADGIAIRDTGNEGIALVSGFTPEAEAERAELIVRAVNNFQKLQDALEACWKQLLQCGDTHEYVQEACEMAHAVLTAAKEGA